MTTPQTPQQIASRVLELDEKATPGPWKASHRHVQCTEDDDAQSGLGLEIEGPPDDVNRGQFEKSADAKLIAYYRAAAPELAREVLAWREYYTAGILLDETCIGDPSHNEAVQRVVRAAEALRPMGDGTLAKEIQSAREWTERENKERE